MYKFVDLILLDFILRLNKCFRPSINVGKFLLHVLSISWLAGNFWVACLGLQAMFL